ncbi:hypothetical protein FRACYDRAFT_256823 [Fragilariopsis cylindrus CCMP1102]|uniref:Uncharacterized protein n=1 Tax=Fragilariopsis cylindrus CCMP1102 TaxID=635003 RepID=A0A1E7EJE5_9STRA|nr:hypothetical protein FRACYDRAFT_256823 [Fragilariopsis cylindrus CCMP1102]|eukprot:OEU06028.1 hypothetical protein FRACYDRAFT_256823 [Fragilariopsis cylindrus CCMP1102]
MSSILDHSKKRTLTTTAILVIATTAAIMIVTEEDEVEEAYDRTRSRTQIVLDPLQVCLYPTPTTDDLNNNLNLQNDMRDSLQELVSQQLENEYGTDFIYFAFTDATIEWYSGQEQDPICGSLDHVLPVIGSYYNSDDDYSNVALANKRDVLLPYSSSTTTTAPPCTCALYKGAVVLLQSDGEEEVGEVEQQQQEEQVHVPTQELLEPIIEAVLQDGLVDSLRDRAVDAVDAAVDTNANANSSSKSSFYTELQGAIITWNVAERQQGDGKLVLRPSSELPVSSSSQLRQTSPPTFAPVTVILDGSNTDATYIDVANTNALEQQQQQSSEANGFQTKAGIILASVLGGLFLFLLVTICCCLCLKKRRNRYNNERYENATSDNDNDDDDLHQPHKMFNNSMSVGIGGGDDEDNATIVSHEDYYEQFDSNHHRDKNNDDHEDYEEQANKTKSSSRRGSRRSSNNNKKKQKQKRQLYSSSSSSDDDNEGDEEDDTSQYEDGELLECISVGGESAWTIGTNATGVTDALGGGNTYNNNNNNNNNNNIGGGNGSGNTTKTLAEMLAAKETFDRDRQITLQKDMLHSEWSSGAYVTSPVVGRTSSGSSSTSSSSKNKNKNSNSNKDASLTSTSTALFQQANGGQGEEIFLMPPRAASRKYSSP